MGTGWNEAPDWESFSFIITDWDMGTGWNALGVSVDWLLIITDWDMGTGWNRNPKSSQCAQL